MISFHLFISSDIKRVEINKYVLRTLIGFRTIVYVNSGKIITKHPWTNPQKMDFPKKLRNFWRGAS